MVLFFICSFLVVFFSLLIIMCKNPVYSIISIILSVVSMCFILFYLEVEFLTYIYLLVYVGAFATLFLFTVMLLNSNQEYNKLYVATSEALEGFTKFHIYACLSVKVYVTILFMNTSFVTLINDFIETVNYKTVFFGSAGDSIVFLNLFGYYFIYFVLISVVLLLAMVGAISICLSHREV